MIVTGATSDGQAACDYCRWRRERMLLAYQCRLGRGAFRVTLIEQRPEIGRGLAYHRQSGYLLNVRVANMSALPEESGSFLALAVRSGHLPMRRSLLLRTQACLW